MLHIYKASAGSGKTYNLTQQYLKLLLGYQEKETGKWRLRKAPAKANRHILAITFTNKATEEMIRRIISQLAILGGREESPDGKIPYLKEFVELFETDAESIRTLASATLDELLADFVYFHVSTIDAFFQNVLRIFAREIEMPDNFDLELDSSYTISIGVNEIFNSINLRLPDDPVKRSEILWIRRWMQQFMERKFDDGEAINLFARTGKIFSELVGTFTRMMDETFKLNIAKISDYLKDMNRLTAFEKALRSPVRKGDAELFDMCRRAVKYPDFELADRYIRDRIRLWSDGIWKEPYASIKKAANDRNKVYASAKKVGQMSKECEDLIYDICCKGVDQEVLHIRLDKIGPAIVQFGLLGYLLMFIRRYCKENNLLLLSDTNTLLRQIINNDETPFVYERMGYYLQNFLIDEFQDTSRMQWKNLKPLIMESLANQNEDLIIGDEKQCIYRFRNSDPDLLGHQIDRQVKRVFGPDAVSIEGKTISQNNNWRSSSEVVRFNNSIFHAIGQLTGDSDTYANVVQQISPNRDKNIPGHVKFILGNKPQKAKKGETEDNNEIAEKRDFSLDTMADEVLRMLRAGYRQRDIAILVRTHSEGQRVIAKLLSCAGTPEWEGIHPEITSVDSIDVSPSPAVKMVIEILRLTQIPQYIENQRGDSEKEMVINPAYLRTQLLYCYEYFRHHPMKNTDGSVAELSQNEALRMAIELVNGNAENRMAFPPEIKHLLDFNLKEFTEGNHEIDKSRVNKDVPGSTLSTIIDRIIDRFVLPSALERETVFLTAFQDLVYDFCSRGNSDIRSFLDWWDRKGCHTGLASTDENLAISVMTIHQSKGLEYPCVIIPYANWDMVNFSTSFRPSTQWFKLKPENFSDIHPDLVPPMVPLDFQSSLEKIDMFSDRVEEIVRQQRIDNLNVAYVAFTRAVNELVVISPAKSSNETLYRYLSDALEKLTADAVTNPEFIEPESQPWVLPLAKNVVGSDDCRIVEVGSPTSFTPSSQKKSAKKPEMYPLPPYSGAVNEKISLLTEIDSKFFDFANPRHRGDFMHAIMRRIRHLDDAPLQIRRAVYRARLTEHQAREVERVITGALADPRVRPWFENYRKIVRERAFIKQKGTERPDRIVWTADGHVDIVDFKFGEPEPKYTTQLRGYAKLLRDNGETNIRAFLWYMTSGKIVQVSLNDRPRSTDTK